MKTAAIASAVFVAAAAAKPRGHGHQHQHAARAMVTETEWVTEVQYVTELVDATTTLWITPGQEPTPAASSTIKGNFFEPPSSAPQAPPASTAVPPPASAAAPPPVSAAAPPPVSTAAPPPPPPQPSTTSSVYTPPPPPPAPTTPSAYAAPPPPPQPSQQPALNNGGGGGAGIAEKGPFNGEITYYDVGMGACGIDDSGTGLTTNIVALSHVMMGTKSNDNIYCNQTITIHAANGKSTTAIVHDKCMGCAVHDIDVSPKAFLDLFGSPDAGRETITWEIN